MAPVGDAVEVGSTGIAAGDRGRLVVGEEGMSREDGWREGVACCVVWHLAEMAEFSSSIVVNRPRIWYPSKHKEYC